MNVLWQKIKTPVLIVFILILGFFAYSHFFGSKGPVNNTQNLSSDVAANAVPGAAQPIEEQDFINLLLKIQHINIDTKIFNDPVFLSLQDDTLPIVDEPQGRDNPFAPLGVQDSISNTATSTSTPAPTTPKTVIKTK